MTFKNFQLIRIAVIFAFMLGMSSTSHAEDFLCRGLHGHKSFLEIKQPLFFGSPVVSIKTIPSGERIEATVVDYGDGWVTFDDPYGYFGEGNNVCEDKYDRNNGKSGPHCGATRKFFKYDGPVDKQGDLKVSMYATKSRMKGCSFYSAGDFIGNKYCKR